MSKSNESDKGIEVKHQIRLDPTPVAASVQLAALLALLAPKEAS